MVFWKIGICRLKIEPTVAGRTHPADVEAAIKVFSESTGGVAAGCEMMAFLGSSQIRCLIEDWSVRLLESRVRETLRRLHAAGVRAAFVTEDTTRSSPELLSVLFRAAIEEGASALVLCDTVGHATPAGTRRLVEWTRILVDDCGAAGRVRIDFHGHNDRGLGVANALEALAAGADRAHGTIMGIGERVGNSALDSLLVNLALQNEITAESFGSKLRRLPEYVNLVSESTNTPLPPSYPAFGSDAFCTATGVHAAAIIKALAFGSRQLSDLVYSSVPASALGLEQVIRIGPQSGESNVVHWARRTPACGIRPGTEKWPPFASSVLRTAQEKKALLEESELLEIATRFR